MFLTPSFNTHVFTRLVNNDLFISIKKKTTTTTTTNSAFSIINRTKYVLVVDVNLSLKLNGFFFFFTKIREGHTNYIDVDDDDDG